MKIKKGKQKYLLKTPLYNILDMRLKIKNYEIALMQVTHEYLSQCKQITGTPNRFAIFNNIIYLYPIPDRDYKSEIIATKIFKI